MFTNSSTMNHSYINRPGKALGLSFWASIGFALIQSFSPLNGQENQTTAQGLEFFEKEIRPLFAENCYKCHSVNSKRLEAGLLLDSRATQLKGGDSGPAIVPGNAEKSLLVKAVRYEDFEMPPKGKLPAKDVAKLVK